MRIHVRNIEKYHPGYKDRRLHWAKIHFDLINPAYNPEFASLHDADKWRFVDLIIKELGSRKPVRMEDLKSGPQKWRGNERRLKTTVKELLKADLIEVENPEQWLVDFLEKNQDRVGIVSGSCWDRVGIVSGSTQDRVGIDSGSTQDRKDNSAQPVEPQGGSQEIRNESISEFTQGSVASESESESEYVLKKEHMRGPGARPNTGSGSERKKGMDDRIPYQQIISHLNATAGKNYRVTEPVRKLIRGRWGEGFRRADFEKVHRVKAEQWKGTDMEKYLRPDTLYRPTKFQGYLNEAPKTSLTKEDIYG